MSPKFELRKLVIVSAFFLILLLNLFTLQEIEEIREKLAWQERISENLSKDIAQLEEETNLARATIRDLNYELEELGERIENLSEGMAEVNKKIRELNFSEKRRTLILGVEDGEGVAIPLETEVRRGSGRILFDISGGNIVLHYSVQLAMRNAKRVASRETNVSLKNFDVIFKLRKPGEKTYIVGESAGAAFTISIIAALKNKQINRSVAVTGVILPDGRIGEVSGIRKKAEAAREAGVKLVLVPLGQERELGGIEIRGVRNITELERYMLY